MKKSWSGLKKELEKDLLCEALKGRVTYFSTSYRRSDDGMESRFAISVDKNEIFGAKSANESVKYFHYGNELKEFLQIPTTKTKYVSYFNRTDECIRAEEFVRKVAQSNCDYTTNEIFHSLNSYKKSTIEDSLNSEDPIVRMFAILDRRVGKRTLKKLKSEVKYQPKWLQFFYYLRFEAEDINEQVLNR